LNRWRSHLARCRLQLLLLRWRWLNLPLLGWRCHRELLRWVGRRSTKEGAHRKRLAQLQDQPDTTLKRLRRPRACAEQPWVKGRDTCSEAAFTCTHRRARALVSTLNGLSQLIIACTPSDDLCARRHKQPRKLLQLSVQLGRQRLRGAR
jgi:hypothetical protein